MAAAFTGKYKLSTINGEAAPADRPMTIEFQAPNEAGAMRVQARCANTMNGNLTYADGVLKGMMMSTRMMGPPEFMKVEAILNGVMDGVNIARSGDNLTISSTDGANTLVYIVDSSE